MKFNVVLQESEDGGYDVTVPVCGVRPRHETIKT